MSDETYEALDAALKAHMADERPDALVTGWAAVAAYITDEPDSDHYAVVKLDGQMNYSTIGLLEVGQRMVDVYGWHDNE